MKVWKRITDLTPEQGEGIDEIFTREDGDLIRNLDGNNEIFSWDYIEDDVYIPYLLCTEQVINILSDLCQKYNFKFGPIDVTEEFLLGRFAIPDSDFEEFRVDNLTEDMVYWKIKKFGVESLDDLDKRILELSI
jgi:hypothetical protein